MPRLRQHIRSVLSRGSSIPSPSPSAEASGSSLVILVHSGGLSGRMFKDVKPLLAYPSVSLDLPGHGSNVEGGPFTFDKAVEQLKSLVAQASIVTDYIHLVGISLGGQVVLAFLKSWNRGSIRSALVSGVSIHPPDDRTPWEMPRSPSEQAWLDIVAEDADKAGADNIQHLQQQSFAFTFEPDRGMKVGFPPTLLLRGENDTAMAKRDFEELQQRLKACNEFSEARVLPNAWHNHSIDVPQLFAQAVNKWTKQRRESYPRSP